MYHNADDGIIVFGIDYENIKVIRISFQNIAKI